MNPEDVYIFRMVHIDNMDHILDNGLCCKDHPNADTNFVAIGHRQLIEDRKDYTINLTNAGTLGEYVPFYFAGHSPMLYMMINGHNGVSKVDQNEIVFIASTLQKVIDAGCDFVFSDRHAKLGLARFYTEPQDLNQLNWNSINDKFWGARDRSRLVRDQKQAEFLIKNYLPLSAIYEIAVYSDKQKVMIEEMLSSKGLDMVVKTDLKRKLYF